MQRHAWLIAVWVWGFLFVTGVAPAAVERAPARVSIYDARFDAEKQIAKALQTARRKNRHVLVQFGANWCSDCQAMHRLFGTDRAIASVLKASYVQVLVDVDSKSGPMRNVATVERFGSPIEGGIPALIVLGPDGSLLTPRGVRSLSDKDHRHPEKVLAFLQKWAPAPPPGKK